jgi:hypothetical protein
MDKRGIRRRAEHVVSDLHAADDLTFGISDL